MNKRRILLTAIISLLLVFAGCSSQSKQTKTSSNVKTETKMYNKLSKDDRDNVKFNFKRYDGAIKGQNQINLTIDNQSNKNVKFDLEDIVLLGSDNLKSDKSGMKTVKTNKKVIIKGIFKDIDDDIFSDPGLFCYKNDSFKLAYLDSKSSKSDNLSDSELKKEYHHFMAHKDDVTTNSESSNVDDSGDSSNDSNNSSTITDNNTTDTNSANDSKSGNVVNSEQEAVNLVESQEGPAGDGEHYTYMYGMWDTSKGKAYWVALHGENPDYDLPTNMGAWTVYPDGTILSGQPTDIDK
ncbi:outer membrane protein assembly factor BamD [Companilactobacillus keshanensis]|uniref:DUF4352 domain-containing protein n=1 Tax=Companilactobacillus keshanensis TaxID=2486003 RepID=A0ABW4BQW0_9LACO|nr:hypothetical protein [Companilactobacillus keshanensis]